MRNISQRRTVRRRGLAAAWAAVVVAGAGCLSRGLPPAATGPVWPPPPAAARIGYERTIQSPADLGLEGNAWRRLGRRIVGLDARSDGLVRPQGVSIDAGGSLCVADPGARELVHYDRVAGRMRRWTAVAGRTLVSPMALVHRGEVFYVADSGLGTVLAFDVRGRARPFTGAHTLRRPTGLAVDAAHVYVADTELDAILVFDLAGTPLRQIGSRGTAPGQFNSPTHVAVDGAGNVYVTDALNFRIQVFDAEGRFLRAIGGPGDGPGRFSRPKGVAVDAAGRIYVVDALFDNVQLFDAEGRLLLHWGKAGRAAGEFWLPGGIAVDDRVGIAVADAYNRRVQVFRMLGGD